jgi:hypothetical protein
MEKCQIINEIIRAAAGGRIRSFQIRNCEAEIRFEIETNRIDYYLNIQTARWKGG